jgi:protein-S-isoprenylcysteine O-methyltransferase Ste14
MNRETMTPRVIVTMLVLVVLVPFLPLLISGLWDWWEAWIYGFLLVGSFVLSRVLAARRHPDLLAERARFLRHADAAPWDRILAPLVGIGSGLILVVAGCEARLDGVGDFGPAVIAGSLAVVIAGLALGSYALIENRFFSGMVRIQEDRGHHVVSSGPYRWVRHPGYLGGVLTYLATPVFLDSPWAVIPAVAFTAVLALRTMLEDATLQRDLAGYDTYAREVRYRLVPGVW